MQSQLCSLSAGPLGWGLSHPGRLLPLSGPQSLGLNVRGQGGDVQVREVTGPGLVTSCEPLSEPWVLL